jgi:hypothetical protein
VWLLESYRTFLLDYCDKKIHPVPQTKIA